MPGLDGIELGRLLARFARPPAVVFVTAHDEHAVDAFELKASTTSSSRSGRSGSPRRSAASSRPSHEPEPDAAGRADETIPVELGGVTRFVPRSEVRYVEAQGDYARLHTADGSHLVRIPLAALEEHGPTPASSAIHRSYLVSLRHITSCGCDSARCTRRWSASTELPVSRRHTRELRDLLVRRAGDRTARRVSGRAGSRRGRVTRDRPADPRGAPPRRCVRRPARSTSRPRSARSTCAR